MQQYIQVGSDTFLGTKDGIKYSLVQSSDNTIRLIEVPSDISTDSNASQK